MVIFRDEEEMVRKESYDSCTSCILGGVLLQLILGREGGNLTPSQLVTEISYKAEILHIVFTLNFLSWQKI